MKMSKLILPLLIFFSNAVVAQAAEWGERGNGADIIVCLKTHSLEVLDLYEARERYKLSPSFPSLQSGYKISFREIVLISYHKVEENITRHDPKLAEILKNLIINFYFESRFIPAFQLFDIPDEGGVLFDRKDCELRQLINQKASAIDNKQIYLISYDLWLRTDYRSKIAAVLHEVIYRTAFNKNPAIKDSEKVRYFNALLISGKMKTLSRQEYWNLRNAIFSSDK